jgi:hypothetical protein
MARIMNLEMSVLDIAVDLAEGNPGAATVCGEMLLKTPQIDPDSALGGLGALLSLDTLEIYGSRIWGLYKDVCGQNLVKMEGVLRANQLGFIGGHAINHAIDNRGEGINPDKLLAEVKEHLPRFGAAAVKEETN